MHGRIEIGVSDRLKGTFFPNAFDNCRDKVTSPVRVGSRVCLIPGQRFEGIPSGDVGTVLHLHDEDELCSVAFDCLDEPCPVPLCYLQIHATLESARSRGGMEGNHDPKSPFSAPPASPAESESEITIASSCLQSPDDVLPRKALTRTASGFFNPTRNDNLTESMGRTTRPAMVPPLPLPLQHDDLESEDGVCPEEVPSFSMCSPSGRDLGVDLALDRTIAAHSSSCSDSREDSAKYPDFTFHELEPRLQEFLRSYSEAVDQRLKDLDDRVQRFMQSRSDQWLDERLNAMHSMSRELETKIAAVSQHLDLVQSNGLRSEEFGDIDKRLCETESRIDDLAVRMETLGKYAENQEQSCSALQKLVENLDQRANLGVTLGHQAINDLAGFSQHLTEVTAAVQEVKSDASKQCRERTESQFSFDHPVVQATNVHRTIAQDVAKQFQTALAEVHLDASQAEASHRQDRNLVLSRLRSELDELHSITSSPLSNATKNQSPVSSVLRASSAPVRERPMHANRNSEATLSQPQAPVSDVSSCASAHTYSVYEASECTYDDRSTFLQPESQGPDACNSSHSNADPTSRAPRSQVTSLTQATAQPIGPAIRQSCSPLIASTSTAAAANMASATAMPSRSASMTCAMCGNMCMDVSELCRRCTVKTKPGTALGMFWKSSSKNDPPSPCRSRLSTPAVSESLSHELREARGALFSIAACMKQNSD